MYSITKDGQDASHLCVIERNHERDVHTVTTTEHGLFFDFTEEKPLYEFCHPPKWIFKTGDNCTFKTLGGCTFKTGDNCYIEAGNDCDINTGDNCTIKAGSWCTFNTGKDCTINAGDHSVFNKIGISSLLLKFTPEEILFYVLKGAYGLFKMTPFYDLIRNKKSSKP